MDITLMVNLLLAIAEGCFKPRESLCKVQMQCGVSMDPQQKHLLQVAKTDHHWLFSNSTNLIFIIENGFHLNESLMSIYNLSSTKPFHVMIVCSTGCVFDIFNQVNIIQTEMMKPTLWLVVPPDFRTVADFRKMFSIASNDEIIAVDRLPCVLHQTLIHFCKEKDLLTYKLQSNGVLKLIKGSMRDSEQFSRRKKNNLNGKHLIASTVEWPPWVIKRRSNGIVVYDGICMDILKEMSRVLNFSFTIVEPEDGSFGTKMNGKWTGLVGQLVDKRVDLVAAPLVIEYSRKQVIDFTEPFFNQPSALILSVPDSGHAKWLTLVAPFRIEVHICILFSLILSTIFLFMVEEVNPGNLWTDNRLPAKRARYGDILWHHFGALVAHGGAYRPSTLSGRIILSCWWLFTVISAATYSGNLIAFLTDWRDKLPFTSLAEMVEQDAFQWGTLGDSVFVNVFKDSPREDYQRIWKEMQNNPLSLSTDLDEHMRRIKTEQYVLLGDTEMVSSGDCTLRMIKDPFLIMYSAFGLQNGSSYTKILSESILRFNELGLCQIWYNKWKPQFECETDRTAKRVDVLGLQSIFYAAGIGIVLACIVLSI